MAGGPTAVWSGGGVGRTYGQTRKKSGSAEDSSGRVAMTAMGRNHDCEQSDWQSYQEKDQYQSRVTRMCAKSEKVKRDECPFAALILRFSLGLLSR